VAKSKSSRRWLQEHFDDPFVKRAQTEGFRSRAVYKLIEIQKKYKIIKPGQVVVDLGAAPGGWSQLCAEWVGEKGQVVALDILPIDPLAGVTIIEADFTESSALEALEAETKGKHVSVVLSDMSPNLSGLRVVDQPKSMYLVELALDFADQVLKKKGTFVAKVFQGEGFDPLIVGLRQRFTRVVVFKPEASRDRSREVYVIGLDRK